MCNDPSFVVWTPNKPGCTICVRVETKEQDCVCSGSYTIDGWSTDIEHDDVYNRKLCPETPGSITQIDVEVFVRFAKAGGSAQIQATLECDGADPLEYCHKVTAGEDGQELKADIGVVFL